MELTAAPINAPQLWRAGGGEGWHDLTPRLRARATHPGGARLPEGRRLPGSAPRLPTEPAFPLHERPRYCVHGRDVLLVGQRALVDPEAGALLNDVSLLPAPYANPAAPLSTFPHEFRMTEGAERAGETLRLALSAQPDAIARPCLLLTSTEARNYGSWLFRIVPKLLTLDAVDPDGTRALLLPQEATRPGHWMHEIASALAPGRETIGHDITRAYALADVLAPSLPAPQNAIPADIRDRLAALAARFAGAYAGDPTRLYVSRRRWGEAHPRRVMENEDALVRRLAARGFTEIAPEALPLPARIDAFARARTIVGPSGSGLFNAAFARPGTPVVEIEPSRRWRPMHVALYRSCGLPHAFVPGRVTAPGPAPDHPDWRADLEAVERVLDNIS